MERGAGTVTRRWLDDPEQRTLLLTPRDDIVAEVVRQDHSSGGTGGSAVLGRFEQAHGPFGSYRRDVLFDGEQLVETTRYRLTLPWFAWLFAPAVRGVLRRRLSYQSWWAPPDRLDATHVLVLGLLAAASMSAAFVNTLFTQTAEFAADDFGVGDSGIGDAGAIVRAGIIFALPAAVVADRIGRRRVTVWLAWLAPTLSLLGALAPSFTVLVASQAVARPMGIALAFLVGVIAAEEMPRNSRAYAISVLAMASGFGAGVAVMSLRLADLAESGWRYVYVVAAVWCVIALDLARRLPETRRFSARRAEASAGRSTDGTSLFGARLDRRRFTLLASGAFCGNVF
ncbi:MAG: MFS transporter, partial [Actinomycetota bacterium]